MIGQLKLRQIFTRYWQSKKHTEMPPISLVPKDDPTTLFTGSGMQQLVPYLSGESHPLGRRLFNIQPCFRSQDIEEIGDTNHQTFFEMMGNWSLGDYFKEEQLEWCLRFFSDEVGLDKKKLYVTVFEGTKEVPRDEESVKIWQKLGIPNERIFYYGPDKNWWSRLGTPSEMPAGEIGGPDSEVFYDFGTPHDPSYGRQCHPNCQCGRFLEIGNSVFIQYKKQEDGSLSELPQKNVDYGGGLERIMAASTGEADVFKTELFSPLIKKIEQYSDRKYDREENKKIIRIIADHLKAATFLIVDGVSPSNKAQGYVLRRLLRRAAVKMRGLKEGRIPSSVFQAVCDQVLETYSQVYFKPGEQKEIVSSIIEAEMTRFGETLERGLKEVAKIKKIDGKKAFDLYQSYGFPFELTKELFQEKGQTIGYQEFKKEFDKHKKLSKEASVGMFKGGLADKSEQVIKYHTATHLIHQALRDVLGDEVRQEGSNITAKRLRFDFRLMRKPTKEEIKKVEEIVNQKIKEKLPVHFEIMPKKKAQQLGALSFFKEKYTDKVKVYFVGGSKSPSATNSGQSGSPQEAYSKELCGGPHVENTGDIGSLKITKVKKIGTNLVRIYAE